MNKITKDNLSSFMEYYHDFHDSNILYINYNIEKAKIEILINVYWSGEPTSNENGSYNTNKTKLKMVFYGVEKCNNKELFSWDYIYNVYLKFIKIKNKEFICFADDEKKAQVYVVCENIEYEEINSSTTDK